MKVEAEGIILSMRRDGSEAVVVEVKLKGKVQGSAVALAAKEVSGTGTFLFRVLAVENLSLGEKLFITLSTEEPSTTQPLPLPALDPATAAEARENDEKYQRFLKVQADKQALESSYKYLIGRTLEQAKDLVTTLPGGITSIRVAWQDGYSSRLTANYLSTRLNVEVADGVIVGIRNIG